MKKLLLLLAVFLRLAAFPLRAAETDLVVYGGTPDGLSAAITAAREGLSVVVIEPTRWIGGMVTGGLTRTDVGKQNTVGGFAREFFSRAAVVKADTALWYAEPHVNMATFAALLKEAGVTVITGQPLKSVTKDGARLTRLTTADGTSYQAKMFVDASYEGDLMAAAKVSYIVGRESREQYGEPLAGYHPMPIRPHAAEVESVCSCAEAGGAGPHYVHGTPASISGVDARGKPIFGVYPAPALAPVSADGRTQAYNFRLCVTQRPDIRVPFPKPADYDPARYELLRRLIEAYPGVRFGRLFHLGKTSHGKCIQGMFWFLCHDERVPQKLREEAGAWGLCRDEFADNAHWPCALYVREARRMIGEYVLVQIDTQDDFRKPDSVGMGSFVIDCHIVQRILAEDGTVRDEGSFQDVPVTPYQIPYRSLTPKRAECENLLVPVCCSASHVLLAANGAGLDGAGAGLGPGLHAAIRAGGAVQSVDAALLQKKAARAKGRPRTAGPRRANSLLETARHHRHRAGRGDHRPLVPEQPRPATGRNQPPRRERRQGQEKRDLPRAGAGGRALRSAPQLSPAPNRATNVPVTIEHADGTATATINQRQQAPLEAGFVSLGTFRFAAGRPAVITVSNRDTDGIVGADTVQLLPAR